MTILAIDTCLAACSAALIDGEHLVFEHSEAMTRGHQERLAPMVGELMAESKADFAAIRTIGVTIGPGSFTGLRVGLAFAKGLGLALGRPCAGVGTLAALAETAGLAGPSAAVIDAGRGNLYLQIFDDPPRPTAPRVLSLDGAAEILSRLPNIADLTLIGPGAGLLAAALPNVRCVPMAAPSAQAVAKLAARAPRGSLQPLYLRPPDAVATAVRVRPTGAAEAMQLARLHACAFPVAWSAADMVALLEGPGVMAHAVDWGGALAGFILSRVAADEAEVLALAVAPERRRKGLGAALLARAAREARTGGAKRLFLEVAADNHSALGLYERAGFAKVGARKAYYDRQGGADALTLALDLNR